MGKARPGAAYQRGEAREMCAAIIASSRVGRHAGAAGRHIDFGRDDATEAGLARRWVGLNATFACWIVYLGSYKEAAVCRNHKQQQGKADQSWLHRKSHYSTCILVLSVSVVCYIQVRQATACLPSCKCAVCHSHDSGGEDIDVTS